MGPQPDRESPKVGGLLMDALFVIITIKPGTSRETVTNPHVLDLQDTPKKRKTDRPSTEFSSESRQTYKACLFKRDPRNERAHPNPR